ncbi:hypothetical protein K501DRAFT_184346 [Backusella circina FSU 941]|nr:hypothetical protein K501DRAFT_184346 [Backusella circina FSU 941]
MLKSAVVPLKSSCRRKVTKPRSKRASSVCSELMDNKSFKCDYDQCEKVFKRSEHLKRHIRSIHTKEKPYKCPYDRCGKQFARSDNLSQHIRIHRPNKEKATRAKKTQSL